MAAVDTGATDAAARAVQAAGSAADTLGRVMADGTRGLSGWLVGADLGTLKPILTALALPPVPWIVLIVIAWGISRRTAAAGGLLVLVALAGLWLGSTAGAGRWLTQQLLDPPPPLAPARLQALARDADAGATAIVVLGGGTDALAPERQAPWLKPVSAARLAYGMTLARRTGWPLAFSGGVGFAGEAGTASEAVAAAAMAREAGMALRWQEGRSRDTRENARYTVPMLRAAGIRRIVLVTDVWHITRALRQFRAAAAAAGAPTMQVEPAPMGAGPIADRAALQWLPSIDGEARVRRVLREWIGLQLGG